MAHRPPKDGGPAFPVLPPCDDAGISVAGYPYPDSGMSLRDWFAGQAFSAMNVTASGAIHPHAGAMAKAAYEYADAMIAAREAPNE